MMLKLIFSSLFVLFRSVFFFKQMCGIQSDKQLLIKTFIRLNKRRKRLQTEMEKNSPHALDFLSISSIRNVDFYQELSGLNCF